MRKLIALLALSLAGCAVGMDGPPKTKHPVLGAFQSQSSYTCAGQQSAPTSGTAICTTPVITGSAGASIYTITVVTQQTGTVDTANPTNLVLQQGTAGNGWTTIATLPSLGAQNLCVVKGYITDNNQLRVASGGNNFAASSLINAWISANLQGAQL